jgi:hypothetical protein
MGTDILEEPAAFFLRVKDEAVESSITVVLNRLVGIISLRTVFTRT